MLTQLSNTYAVATLYAAVIALPLFTLLTLVWGWNNTIWRSLSDLPWWERSMLHIGTIALALAPAAGLFLGFWTMGMLVSLSILVIIIRGLHYKMSVKLISIQLAVSITLTIASIFIHSPIISLLIFGLMLNLWNIWFNMIKLIGAINMAWFAVVSLIIMLVTTRNKQLYINEAEQRASLALKFRALWPKVVKESIMFWPAVFLCLILVKNMF